MTRLGLSRFALAVVAALLVTGCASTRPRAAQTLSQLTGRPPRDLAEPIRGAPIGTSQRVDTRGAHLQVTVSRVIDPLRGAGARLQPGTRPVGVLVQIASSGAAVYDSSATGDFTVVVSAGTVTPVLATRGVCRTPLEDFDRDITAGEVRVGCVVFAISRRAVLEGVRFDPHAQERGRLSWTL